MEPCMLKKWGSTRCLNFPTKRLYVTSCEWKCVKSIFLQQPQFMCRHPIESTLYKVSSIEIWTFNQYCLNVPSVNFTTKVFWMKGGLGNNHLRGAWGAFIWNKALLHYDARSLWQFVLMTMNMKSLAIRAIFNRQCKTKCELNLCITALVNWSIDWNRINKRKTCKHSRQFQGLRQCQRELFIASIWTKRHYLALFTGCKWLLN